MAEATSLNATVSTQASLAQFRVPSEFIRATENRRFFFRKGLVNLPRCKVNLPRCKVNLQRCIGQPTKV